MDTANERSARSMAVTQYLSDAKTGTVYYEFNLDANSNFTIVTAAGSTTEITTGTVAGYGKSSANEGKVIVVTVVDGSATSAWVAGKK